MYGNGPVFKAEGTSFRDQPYAEQLPQGLWTTGLCDCHEDAHICTYQNVSLRVFCLIFLLVCCLKTKWFFFFFCLLDPLRCSDSYNAMCFLRSKRRDRKQRNHT